MSAVSSTPHRIRLAVTAVAAIAFGLSGRASRGEWRPIGPEGGTVFSLERDPHAANRVYAGTYFGAMADYVDVKDVLVGVYKSIAFGGLIAWVCCFKGYYAGFGAEGVSKATTQAVVLSSVLILVCDYVMTSVLF